MDLEKYRNPNGTYDGLGTLAEITRLPREEIVAMAAQVRANSELLRACPWHEFEKVKGMIPTGRQQYRCRHCQGEVDHSAYHWHQQGRRPMPVGEP